MQAAVHSRTMRPTVSAQCTARAHGQRLCVPLAPSSTWSSQRALLSVAVRVSAPSAGEAFGDDIDWTEDLPTPIRRRVLALREVQGKYDELFKQYQRERAELEAKYQQQAEPLLEERVGIIGAEQPVGKYDLPDSEEKDEGIPEFWLTAMTNHEMVGEYVTERDAQVLSFLKDVRTTTLTGEDAGSFRITFTFAPNDFFSNTVLEKTFYLEDAAELVPRKFVGTTIDWAPGKDTTVQVVKKRVNDKKLKGKAPAVTVSRTEPCDSFFNFFRTPVIPENPEEMGEEELEQLQEVMDEDFELGLAFKESIVPRAVEWYTGEAAPPMVGDEYDEGEFEDPDA